MSQPTPSPLLKAKLKTAGVAAAALTVTAGMTMGATFAPEIMAATDRALAVQQAEIDLAASIGIYPSGPLFQAARMVGLGNPDAMLETLQNLASLIGQSGIAGTIGTVRDILDLLGPFLPDMRVPGFGPAGVLDAVDSLGYTPVISEGLDAVLSLVKTGQLLGSVIPADFWDALGPLGDIGKFLVTLPLNVPGKSTTFFGKPWLGVFDSSVNSLAIVPTWGLGGTNVALASSELMKLQETAIVVIALRNTSRPGGGIVALLNPLSQLLGLNLANADGRGTPKVVPDDIWDPADLATTTKYDGNLTTWDITAAYDLLSDAPSTVLNPLAWLNSGVGFVMPTYLVPKNLGNLGDLLADLLGGDLIKQNVGADGNLYVTYIPGNLPLLEPFQAAPRLLSLIPGFDITTPVSGSFEDVLSQMVAMGYQDVKLSGDGVGQIPTFVRQFNEGGTQAQFWTSPVGFEDGLQAPQALFNALINGLSANLLSPGTQSLELFGSTAIGDALYDNGLTTAVANLLKEVLDGLQDALNPVFDAIDSNSSITRLAGLFDDAVGEVNGLIDQGLETGAEKTPINLTGPMLSVNRWINDVTEPLDNGIPNAIASLFNGGSSTLSSSQGLNALNVGQGMETFSLGTISEGLDTDFLGNNALGNRAKLVAKTLKSEVLDAPSKRYKSLISGESRKDGKSSLSKRADELGAIGKSLSTGKIGDAAEGTADFVKDRATRAGKDLKNGTDKVANVVKKLAKGDSE